MHDTTPPQNFGNSSPPLTTYTIPNEHSRLREIKCCGCLTLRGGNILMTFFAFVMIAIEVLSFLIVHTEDGSVIPTIGIIITLALAITGIFALRSKGYRAAMIFQIEWWIVTLLTFVGTIVSIATGTAADSTGIACQSVNEYSSHRSCKKAVYIGYIVLSVIQIMFMIYGGVSANRFARLRKAEYEMQQSEPQQSLVEKPTLESQNQSTV
ncbi:hypothetical protein BGW38_005052 [Lunasporangiospora selenospora]|uniref:Uncharacterized protein n=1 Tax=Lunasporangiospora selenospora TaxID=979761 RepID=A0A9P6G200_9FUNG|nr:hypothetical protein BGW38_005052 [Lunasporangiospora selenospora]